MAYMVIALFYMIIFPLKRKTAPQGRWF